MRFSGLPAVEDDIDDDAEDQAGGDGTDGDSAEVQGQAADAGHQDGCDHEQVAVVIQIHRLQHLEAADRDEAVQRDANAAHDAAGDGVYEAYKRIEEGQDDAVHGRDGDGGDAGIAGNGDAADALAVGGVRAAAEEGTDDGADAVADQGFVQAGVGDQVMLDDGGEVLVVRDMFSQSDERHGGEEHEEADDVSDSADLVGGFGISAEHAQESEARHFEELHVVEGGQVDQLHGFVAGAAADQGEDQGDRVRAENADDEGNHPDALVALGAGVYGDDERDHAHQDGDQVIAAGGGVVQVVDRAAAEGKTDQRNGGADDDRRQQFVDPLGTSHLDDQGNDDVYQAGKQSAQEDAQEAESYGAGQRADEREGAAQEDGTLLAGRDEEIEQRAEARAAQRGRLAHIGSGAVHQDRDQQGRSHDGQQLLECVQQVLFDWRILINVVDKLHKICLPYFFGSLRRRETARRIQDTTGCGYIHPVFCARRRPAASCRSLCTVLKTYRVG